MPFLLRPLLLGVSVALLAPATIQAENLLSGSDVSLTFKTSQHNRYPATRLIDGNTTSSYISGRRTFNNTLIFRLVPDGDDGAEANPYCLNSFTLYNYWQSGNRNKARRIKNFLLYTTDDETKTADTGTDGWEMIPLDGAAASSNPINFLDKDQGGTLISYTSQHNRYPASRLNDNQTNREWLGGRYQMVNTLTYGFDTNLDGTPGESVNIDTLRLYNTTRSRAIQSFQVETQAAGSSDWVKLSSPDAAVGTTGFNFLSTYEGGKLVSYTSQHNRYPATRINDMDTVNPWLSKRYTYANTLEYNFDTDLDEVSGDLINVDSIKLWNYNHNRGVKDFQVEYKVDGSSIWNKIPVPGTGAGDSGYNFLNAEEGGTLSSYTSQHASYPASRLNDRDTINLWLSKRYTIDNTFIYDFDTDNDGSVGDVINIDSFRLLNYNHNRGIKKFQISTQASGSSTWTKIEVPGTSAGDAGFNYSSTYEGGSLGSYSSQHASYPASRMTNGDTTQLWLSQRYNIYSTFDYVFDTDGDGATGDAITIDTFRLYNYNHNRGVKKFQVSAQTKGTSTWTKMPVAGTAAGDANFNFASVFEGGSLSSYTSQHASYPASRLNDINTTQVWYGARYTFVNELVYEFDTDLDGSAGDAITITSVELTNYNHNRGIKDFEIYVQQSGGPAWVLLGSFTATKTNSPESFAVASTANVTAVKLKTLTNYGDGNYIGAREFRILGTAVGASHTFTATKQNAWESFTLPTTANIDKVRFAVLSNYGDGNYSGARELEILGPSVGPSHTFTALKQTAWQSWTLSSSQTNVAKVKLHMFQNYGDRNYIGAKEFEVLGDSVGPSYTFTALKQSAAQEWTLDSSLADVVSIKLKTLSNNGDRNYIGINEFAVLGKATRAGNTFTALRQSGWQEWALAPPVSNISGLRLTTLMNFGDRNWLGATEFQAVGSPVGSHYIYEANNQSDPQTWTLPEVDGKLFRVETIQNYGDGNYIGANEMQLEGQKSPCVTECILDTFTVTPEKSSASLCPEELIKVDITPVCESGTGPTWTGNASFSTSPGSGTFYSDRAGNNSIDTLAFTGAETTQSIYLKYTNPTDSLSVKAFDAADSAKSGSSAGIEFIPNDFGFQVSTIDDFSACTQSKTITLTAYGIENKGESTEDPKCVKLVNFTGTAVNTELSLINPSSKASSTSFNLIHSGTSTPLTNSPNSVPMTFSAGSVSFVLEYDDVGQMQLEFSFDTAPYSSMSGASNVFSVYPDHLSLKAEGGGSQLTGNDANSSTTWKAGEDFTFSVSGVCADETITQNYEPNSDSSLLIKVKRAAPDSPESNSGVFTLNNNSFSASTSASFTESTIAPASFENGVYSDSQATYSEVGIINIEAKDSYFGNTINTKIGELDSLDVGRFIPHHFTVADNVPSFANDSNWACDFTYLDQGFTFLNPPELTVTAVNKSGNVTMNYGGDFWKLSVPDVTESHYVDTADVSPFSVLSSGDVAIAGINDYDGQGTISLNNAEFQYVRLPDMVSPFAAGVNFILSSNELTDSDNVFYSSTSPYTSPDIYSVGISGTTLKHGRLKVSDNFGPENEPITNSPFSAQYWSGNAWQTNNADSCTTGVAFDQSSASVSSSPIVFNGEGALNVINPVEEKAEITVRPTSPLWLECQDCASGCCGTFTFGIFRGNDRILNWKEILR